MKRLIFVFGVLYSTISIAQTTSKKGTIKALDEKYGFRDMTFGTDTTATKDLVYTATTSGLRAYTRPGNSLSIGGAELTSILYGYYKGKFAVVMAQSEGANNAKSLLDALVATYGYPVRPNPYLKEYYWRGQSVVMTLKTDALNKSSLILQSVPLYNQIAEEQKAKANKASSDL